MRYPNFSHERSLRAQGFTAVAGVDEVGRGAWAGPIVAAAVILMPDKKISGIRDSKLLSGHQREHLHQIIIKKAVAWAIGVVSGKEIDEQGMAVANTRVMELAVRKLSPAPNYLLIDAFALHELDLPALSIRDGDWKVASIAAASIIAKVTRDQMMVELAEQFPHYGFEEHKGYGTALHQRMLKKYGPCSVHRFSYEPIRQLQNTKKS